MAVNRLRGLMSNRNLIAVCQFTASHDRNNNFKICSDLLKRASGHKAKMVFLPECFDYIGRTKEESVSMSCSEEDAFISKYRELAVELGLWISLGGFHEKNNADPNKAFNTHLLLDSTGKTIAKYRKLHLFDVDIPGGIRIKETDFSTPGSKLVSPVETPVGRIGLATCYDLRFPAMSSWLREKGADILTYPSAFTLNTGLAHWEALLRGRAIENQCYVVAAAQTGTHNEKRKSYGHTMVVDPWGTVIAQCGEGPGLCLAEVDLEYLRGVRQQLPCFQHRRTDLYETLTHSEGTRELLDNGPEEYAFAHHRIPKSCVFYRTPLSFALVNRAPIVEGHVMACPVRPVERLTDLGPAEVADLFSCAQKVQLAMMTAHNVSATTLTVQDGFDAGQTVKHVHVHILPRRPNDFPADNNDIYKKLEIEDKRNLEAEKKGEKRREWRSVADMSQEAHKYQELMLKDA